MPRPDIPTEQQALLILNALPEIGPITLRRLMDAFGHEARRILAASPTELKRVRGVGDAMAAALRGWRNHVSLEKEEARLDETGARFVTARDPGYPELLKEIYDPPIGLYWKGDELLRGPHIAIVGTRRPTLYGQAAARKLAGGLARRGCCVVSGLARGIDTAAHEGALEADGQTAAVLGCGLDIIYPAENLDLYRRIAVQGAVLSEFPFGRRADRQSFPMRNRIVAGMCSGLIVVESGVRGGSLITARFAGDQGRTVFAVPGRIDQAASQGCHQLIRDGAVLVQSVDDVLEELQYLPGLQSRQPNEENATASPIPELSPAEAAVMALLADGAILSPDEIGLQTDLAGPELGATLMMLELKRLIAKRVDGAFEAR